MNNTRCRRCNHAIKQIGRDVHYCSITRPSKGVIPPNGLCVITYDAKVVALGNTIMDALWDEEWWKQQRGLLPDVPWSAGAS